MELWKRGKCVSSKTLIWLLKTFLRTQSTFFSPRLIRHSTSRKKSIFFHHLNCECWVHPHFYSTTTLCSMDSIPSLLGCRLLFPLHGCLVFANATQVHLQSQHSPPKLCIFRLVGRFLSLEFFLSCLSISWVEVRFSAVSNHLVQVMPFGAHWTIRNSHQSTALKYLKTVTMSLSATRSLLQAKWPRSRRSSFMPHKSQSSHHAVSFSC